MDCWTGNFEVLFTERSEGFGDEGKYGAFVNVVAYAQSEISFRELATQALYDDGYTVLAVEEMSQIDFNKSGFPNEEHDRILEWFDAGFPVGFGAFHCYPKNGLGA